MKENELPNFSYPLKLGRPNDNKATDVEVKANIVLIIYYIIRFSVSQTKALKTCLQFSIFNCSKQLHNIFEIGLTKCAVIEQKAVLEKKIIISNEKIQRYVFVAYMLN